MFNGAPADSGRLQQGLVAWLVAAADVVHTHSAVRCKVKLSVFELEQARAALVAVQSGRAVGKLVVKVNDAL